MVESFQVPQNEVGKWAGMCAAIFSLFQAVFGVPWGRFSDRYGRKPAILLGLTSTMFTTLLLGFSKSLPMAIVARALAGAGNGNVGIIRTTVAEMVPFKELQPRAFSLMPLVWNVGSIFGPTIGGALANPYNVKPGENRSTGNLLEIFPYALPNIVSALFFAIGITTGFLFLEETLEGAENRRDYGLLLGKKITSTIERLVLGLATILHLRSKADDSNPETEPLIKHTSNDEEDSLPYETKPDIPRPTWRSVLNRQAVINLVVYTLLAMHAMAFDQLIPVFLQHDPIGTPDSTPFTFPLKFAGGFGLNHFQIGLMSTFYGVAGMFVQFFIFPPLCRRFGVLFWLKIVACIFPIIYLITPFTALLPTTHWQVGCMFTLMTIKCLCGIFAFPCSTILLTNSATSLRTLGTLNGIATSVSAIGRAVGPAMAGAIYTAGVKKGYVIAPWWFLAGTAIVAAVPIWWLVEGEGFGGDDEVSDEEDEEEEEEGLLQAGLEGQAEGQSQPEPLLVSPRMRSQDTDDDRLERAYGGLAPLSRTTTMGSSAMSDDEEGTPSASRAVSRKASGVDMDGQGGPSTTTSSPTLSRRNSKRIMRKMSIPIGMGSQGISRRYSSNLGQSFGSAGSYQ
jgi:MFS family permease